MRPDGSPTPGDDDFATWGEREPPAPPLPTPPRRRRPAWAIPGAALAAVGITTALAVSLASGAAASPSAVANTISLRVSDLAALHPKVVTLPHRQTEHTNALLTSCYAGDTTGASASLVLVQSYDVQTAPVQQEVVASEVIVKSSAASAARDLAVYRTPSYMRCEAQAFATENKAGGTNPRVQATPLPFAAPGSDGGFGWRQTVTLQSAGYSSGTGTVAEDVRGFIIGRYEVVLVIFGQGNGPTVPFPTTLEQPLLTSLLARARSQTH